MFEDLFLFFEKRYNREKNRLKDDYIINESIEKIYTNKYRKSEYCIYLCLPTLVEYEVDLFKYLNKNKYNHFFSIEDYEQLMFIILTTFDFDPQNKINNRLKFLSLKNLFYFNSLKRNKFIEFDMQKELFDNFLISHSSSEEYLKLFKLINNKIFYKNSDISVLTLNKLYFSFVKENKIYKKEKISLEDLIFTEKIIDKVLKCILGVEHLKNTIYLKHINSFFNLYYDDKEYIYQILDKSLDKYILSSWKNFNYNTSIFYGSENNDKIEYYQSPKKRYNRQEKLEAEYFIDMFIFYCINEVNDIDKVNKIIKSDFHKKHLFNIICYHPFFIYNKRKKDNLSVYLNNIII